MSDESRENASYIKECLDRISELEKKPCMKITEIFTPTEVRMLKLTQQTIGEHTTQIAELREATEEVIEAHLGYLNELREQIENIWKYLPSDLGEQIAELRESIDYFKPLQNVNDIQRQLTELKERCDTRIISNYNHIHNFAGVNRETWIS